MDIGMGEILLILVFALLVYGGRLPEVARSLGKSLAEVKKSLAATTEGVQRQLDEVGASVEPIGPEEERPRTVRRVVPAVAPSTAPTDAVKSELATEDVSGAGADPAPESGSTPKP